MQDRPPASIKQLLQTENSALQRIFSKVEVLKQLNQILMQELEPSLKSYCLVANLHPDTLVVAVQNASIATQFRFCIPELLEKLKKYPFMKDIKAIECKVLSS